MPWLNQFIWRFIVLFGFMPIIYGVFGWYSASESTSLSEGIINQLAPFGFAWEQQIVVKIIYGATITLILLITSGLTLLVDQMTVLFGTWFKSDTRAIISVLGWSFAVVVIIRWISYFFRFVILLSVTILGRLELQEFGCNKWQIFAILTAICLGSYSLGVLVYSFGNSSLREETSGIYGFFIG